MTEETICRTRHLELVRSEEGWEFVRRRKGESAVAVVAVTNNDEIVLVEQYRPPVKKNMIELPAGIIGDTCPGEEPLDAAERELMEETGYGASGFIVLKKTGEAAGLINEPVWLVLATGLTKKGAGGGTDDENIKVHTVPLKSMTSWLASKSNEGMLVDIKIYAGLWLAMPWLPATGTRNA